MKQKELVGFFIREHSSEKYYPFFLLVILCSIPLILFLLGKGVEWIIISIALLAVAGIAFQSLIRKSFFMPIFRPMIKQELIQKDNGEEEQKGYDLNIKNVGFSSAKNVRAKIKDAEEKDGINLPLSHRKSSQVKKEEKPLPNISARKEEDFNIGSVQKTNNVFTLSLLTISNDCSAKLFENEEKFYFLEIMADNTKPLFLGMKIIHRGYENFNVSSIKILY